ncbi:MAG: hypothetical protein KDC37_05045, partial [Flavobacteriales bacterium]|nr:hypothetical protein [Flavobacteriales bacterium]
MIVGTADTLYHSVNAPEYFPATDSIYTVYSLVTPNGDALDDRLLNQLMFTHRSFDKRTDLQFVTLTWPKSHENITWRHSQEVAGRDTLRWKIVEMPLEQLKAFASHQLLLGDTLWPPLDVRRNMFVITDKRGHIRSYIDASQYTEGKKLRDDLKVLKAEEFVPKKREK